MRRRYLALRDQPITDQGRWPALTLAALTLIAAGVLLSLTAPHPTAHRAQPPQANTAHPRRVSRPANPQLLKAAAGTARVFLTGYLAYIYGHTTASHAKDTTTRLGRALQAHPPVVSPAMRARHPRVVSLDATPTASGALKVTALVNDGELIDYPIRLLLTPHDGRPLVSALEED